jgi:prefoldin subunit 5
MSAGVFRGYFASEKAFSMGIESDANNYKYNVQQEYTKDDFSGQWEKVTYMTYYINDSIANNYVFVDGYWWANGEWTWQNKSVNPESTNPKDYDLNYIVQPDKFFVRLGFLSDYTEFLVDNLSLTKSWIAGCEYDKDKMRVDFGYKTNIIDLAKAAYAENKIAAKEVDAYVADDMIDELGYEYYFEVWGLNSKGEWEDVPIRSAEYHDDGYMYMFTDFYKVGDEYQPFLFDDYDSVLVTFHNPVDQADLCLKYTGTGADINNVFPMAIDTAWIKAGKIVPDFYNEIAQANPYIFDGVHSLKDLPPVMQVAPYEEGSFGLDQTREFRFKFSREVILTNETDPTKKAVAYVNDETWDLSWDAETSELVLTRPAKYTADLRGDYEIQINQIYGIGTEKGENVIAHYNFGPITRVFESQVVKKSDWRSEIVEDTWDRPMPGSLYTYNNSDGFYGGDGHNYSPYKKNGLYKANDDGVHGDCFFYFTARTNGKYGSLWTTDNLKAGNYVLSFPAFGWARTSLITEVYVYPKPEEMTYEALEGSTKTKIGEIQPSKETSWSDNNESRDWIADVETFELTFSIPADGDYVIEWRVNKDGSQSYYGVAVGNYTISTAGDLCYASTAALNKSVDAAKAQAALADEDIAHNGGNAYDALKLKIEYYDYNPQGAFTSTVPSEWAAAKKDLDDATAALKTRMDDVKKFVDEIEKVINKLTETETLYSGLETWKALDATRVAALAINCPDKTSDDLAALIKDYEAAIAALDARVAAVTAFDTQIARATRLINAKEKEGWNEYPIMVSVYDANKEFDKINESDDNLAAATAALQAANDAYEFKLYSIEPLTKRILTLHDIAAELGSDIVENEAIEAIFDANEVDDDNLAEVYKSAIKVALYEKIAEDPEIDTLDLSPFIKNYYLYQTVKVCDRSDKNMPDNNNAGADPDGANMQYTQHKWNSGDLNGKMPIWVMITNVEYSDLYPGWTVKAFNEGNAMVTGDKSYNNYKQGLPIFDAEIGMDWNGKAEMYTTLTDLPVGMYMLGVELTEFTANEGEGKIATLDITTPDSTYSNKAVTSGVQTLAVDSIVVAEGDALDIKFMLRSQNGWSRADNFFLSFVEADAVFDYEAAAAAEKSNLAKLISVVDLTPVKAAKVEYYNLDGVKMDAPKAGISIRVSTLPNGKRIVEKILVK